jgi:hypothetical protein
MATPTITTAVRRLVARQSIIGVEDSVAVLPTGWNDDGSTSSTTVTLTKTWGPVLLCIPVMVMLTDHICLGGSRLDQQGRTKRTRCLVRRTDRPNELPEPC